jgi:hypothetical protein
LATLLGVQYEGTEIEEAGLTLDAPDDKMNRLVRDFWKTFHATYKNCIPAGIIFLPGKRVQLGDAAPGYGWAPKTWMSAHEVDFPDPLSRWTAKTDLLEGNGLLVEYPGFIFSTDSLEARKQLLAVDQTSIDGPAFAFPVDKTLLEWYSVRPADPGEVISGLEGIVNSGHPLAIILSRPQPKAAAEIGLLVEIYRVYDEFVQDSDDASTRRYNCQIIRRVHVQRETGDEYLTGPGINGPQQKDKGYGAIKQWQIMGAAFAGIKEEICIGQALPVSQRWVVDGYIANRGKKAVGKTAARSEATQEQGSSSVPVPPIPQRRDEPTTMSPAPAKSGWGSVARAFTFGYLGRSPTGFGGQTKAKGSSPSKPPIPGKLARSTTSPVAQFSARGESEDEDDEEEEDDLGFTRSTIKRRDTLWEAS